MKSLMLNMMAAAALVFLCGCTTVNWNLPQGFDPQHAVDRFYIQINPVKITNYGNYTLDPEIADALKISLYHKFTSSSRFVVLSEQIKGDLTGTQNKYLEITPKLALNCDPWPNTNVYFCSIRIICQLLDLETGAHSSNGADDIEINETSDTIQINKCYNQEHYSLRPMDVDTLVNVTIPRVCEVLEKKIAEKFPVNARVTSVESTRSGIKVHIKAGTSNGLRSSDLFKVYAVKNKMVTVVAMAKGLVGANDSTLTITKWNEDDATVRDIYMPQMMQNRADDLFVVAEPKKSQ